MAMLWLSTLVAGCSGKPPADPKNREISWAYPPNKGAVTSEHLRATGKDGGAPITRGWQCRLVDGKQFTIQAYQLAESHPLFGKVQLTIGLFDKTGKDLASLQTTPISKENASFRFELSEAVAKELWDVVIWFRAP
jgi:hypothetical protein